MKEEDYVSLEVAKLLQEKGFPQECEVGTICRLQNKANNLYENTRAITESDLHNAWCIFNEVYPSLYEAQKWLREKHRILVNSIYDCCSEKWFYDLFKMYKYPSMQGYSDSIYSSYEEALNEGILEALKLI